MQGPRVNPPRVVLVDRAHPNAAVLEEAAMILRRGGLVAFPTETVYGLGGLALDAASIRRIFEAKGRPPTHPIIAHVLGEEEARLLAAEWSELASDLARAFWPGPLTIVVPKKNHLPLELTGGGDSIGIRAPAHPVARALLAAVGEPIAAPSANRFQEVSPTQASHVAKSMGAAVDLILDGGSCDRGIESTVVMPQDDGSIRVLRPGSIGLADLRPYGAVVHETLRFVDEDARPSPGLDVKHYSPKARLVIAPRNEMASRAREGDRAGLIFIEKTAEIDACARRTLPADAREFASALYATLHDLDDCGCDLIIVEAPPLSEEWMAVRDRLGRAARSIT